MLNKIVSVFFAILLLSTSLVIPIRQVEAQAALPPPGSEELIRQAIQNAGSRFRGLHFFQDDNGRGPSYCRAQVLYDDSGSDGNVIRDTESQMNRLPGYDYFSEPAVLQGGMGVFFGVASNFVWQTTDQFPCPPPYVEALAAEFGLQMAESGHLMNNLNLATAPAVVTRSHSTSFTFEVWMVLPLLVVVCIGFLFLRVMSMRLGF